MVDIRHLGVIEVVALHAEITERTGSAPMPLRAEATLESAVHRTRMASIFGGEEDLIWLATLLAVGISQSQAFVEGNKRTAYIAADAFLRLNGLRYAGDPLAMSDRLTKVAEQTGDRQGAEADFAAWLRPLVQPRQS
jgi:death on curing protein